MDSVLIVDDSSFIVEGLISFLKKKYLPLAAYGGAECLEILKHETPSVIILDIMMEPMDGWETLARIKENPETRTIPVLMFSAKKISPEEAEAHRIRIDDFITKPVSPKKIIEAIEKVLARRDSNREIVSRWRSAGMSQEKIDEYLSLVTSLEVDLSLCQNMKIQNEITHPGDKDQDEFNAVITAIEDRIRQERGQIDALAREMNDALEHLNGSSGPAAAASLVLPGESSMRDGAAGSSAGEESSPAAADHLPELPVPGQAGAGPGNPVDDVPDPAAGSPPGPLPVPEVPVPEIPQKDSQSPGTAPGPEVSDLPERPDPAPAPAVLPGPPDAPVHPDTGAESGGVPGTRPEIPAPGDSTSPVISAADPPGPGERNVIPADPDIPPASPGISSATGAGTDIPMPWDNARDRRAPKPGAGPETNDPAKQNATPPAQGLFGRILSLIRSVFGKRD